MADTGATFAWALSLLLCGAAVAVVRVVAAHGPVVLDLLARLREAEDLLAAADRRARAHARTRGAAAWTAADEDRQRAMGLGVARLASEQNELRWLLLSERPWSRYGRWLQAAALLASVPPLRQALAARRSARRRRAGLCVTCGYCLRGNVSGVCPECGSPAERVD